MQQRLPVTPQAFQTYFERTGSTCVDFSAYQGRERKTLFDMLNKKLLWKKGDFVTTPYVYKVEKEIARRVIEHRDSESKFPKVSYSQVSEMIKEYEKLEGERLNVDFHLAPEQAEAVHKALNAQVFVLTGGPGTGKTCVLKCIQYVLKSVKPDAHIVFTAPTGKAARRITESTGEPACTIHKKMSLISETSKPYPIFCDCIIVDEISMLDTLTADAFFMAVQLGAKILLVGDVDQLPSVGYGSVLRDLLQSNQLECEGLRAPQRQDSKSVLFQNITNLRYGQPELFQGDDFSFVDANEENGKDVLLEEYFKAVDKWGIENVCCLTPYRRKGSSCANVINDIIQSKVNPPEKKRHITTWITEDDDEKSTSTSRQITFVEGDPVIQLVNRAEIANGDVGKVTKIDGNHMDVLYEGDITVTYSTYEMNQLNLAYAMSVHKSQGSEYKCVVTSALPEHKQLLCRNMLYTAVTRAKKDCVLVCDKETVEAGLKVQAGYERDTLLRELIEHEGRKANLLKSLQNIA